MSQCDDRNNNTCGLRARVKQTDGGRAYTRAVKERDRTVEIVSRADAWEPAMYAGERARE